MAYVDIYGVQQQNFNVRVAGLDPSYYTQRYADFYIRTPNGSYSYAGGSGMISSGVGTSPSINISGLSPGTTYIVKAIVYNYWNDVQLGPELTDSVTTQSPPDYTPPTIGEYRMSIPSHGCTNSSTISFYVNIADYGSGVASVYMQFNGQNQTWSYGGNGDYTFTVNTPVTPGKYQLGVTARDAQGNKADRYFDIYVTYDTLPPNITAYSAELATGSYGIGITVSAQATDNVSGVHQYIYRISLKNNSSAWGDWVYVTASSSPKHTFTKDGYGYSIEAGARYYLEYKAVDRANNYSAAKSHSYVPAYAKPQPWYWSAYEISLFNGNGEVKNFTRARWNEFIKRIGEFDKYKNGVNAGKYYLDQAEIPNSTDPSLELTAYRFNTARHAIGSMAPGGSEIDMNLIKKDLPVMGWYFTKLSEKLNQII